MKDAMMVFEKEEFGKVRVIEKDGSFWFVATDVAKALGYEKPNNAVNTHCKKVNKINYPVTGQAVNIIKNKKDDDEKGTHIVRTPGDE